MFKIYFFFNNRRRCVYTNRIETKESKQTVQNLTSPCTETPNMSRSKGQIEKYVSTTPPRLPLPVLCSKAIQYKGTYIVHRDVYALRMMQCTVHE